MGPLVRIASLLIVFAVSSAWTAVASAEKRLPGSKSEIQLSFAPLVSEVAPTVVNIYTRKIVRGRRIVPLFDDPFFRRFFGDQFGLEFGPPGRQQQNSLGSGVIVDPGGLIVTNRHVIEGADEITVVLADRREFEAKLIATDQRTDLAILRIDPNGKELPAIAMKDSDDVEVGDLVLAIGNPFGVGQTVTSGIVSALARTGINSSDLNTYIQTDAAINPGNSGGALIAMDGGLVGINTAIFSKSGGSLGIGFAIPSNIVRAVIAGIGSGGKFVRPWFGATGQEMSQDIAFSLGLERPTGVLISEIYEGAAADASGVRVGDVILAVNGREVNNPDALKNRIATYPIGETVTLRVWRRQKELALTMKLARAPELPPRDATELRGRQPIAGATVANMSPALAEELNMDPYAKGVLIVDIKRGSNAHRLRFRIGDFIVAINGAKIETVAGLTRILESDVPRWRIDINRGGRPLNLVVDR